MFKVRLRVRKYKRDVMDPGVITDAMDGAATHFAHAVSDMFLTEVADWSTEHGRHDATPMRKAAAPATRINIYLRGELAYIFALQDMGYTRKIAIVGGYGRPKFGAQGTLVTGRLLRNPVPVAAKHYTERIAAAVRAGDTNLGGYRQYMQGRLDKLIRDARGGRERVYE